MPVGHGMSSSALLTALLIAVNLLPLVHADAPKVPPGVIQGTGHTVGYGVGEVRPPSHMHEAPSGSSYTHATRTEASLFTTSTLHRAAS
jgi:hypothetical protein